MFLQKPAEKRKFHSRLKYDRWQPPVSANWEIWEFLHLLPEECHKIVVHATVTSRLDYANGLYLGLPKYLIRRLQMVQNAAARLIRRVPFRHHVSPHIKELHWLPVAKRIVFKALTLVFRAMHGNCPSYLKQRLCCYKQTRSLRSNSQKLLCTPRFRKLA